MKLNEVVLIDDDFELLQAQTRALELVGIKVSSFTEGLQALRSINNDFAGIIVTDIRMPQIDGFEVFKRAQAIDREIPVLLLTGHGDIAMAVRAIKDGAFDFFTKPYDVNDLILSIERALKSRKLIIENRQLRLLHQGADNRGPQLLGTSPQILKLKQTITKLAEIEVNVHISGEIGTEKDIVARALTYQSNRRTKPLVHIHANSLDESNFRSELFGAEAGIKFGNHNSGRRTIGLFEKAAKGTLFIEGVEHLIISHQEILAKTLASAEYMPLGAAEPKSIGFRLLTSSEQELSHLYAVGQISSQLYYHLSGIQLRIPPLNERIEDIPLIFQNAVIAACIRHSQTMPQIDPTQMAHIMCKEWPGNTLELSQFAEQFALGLSEVFSIENEKENRQFSLNAQVADFERHLIEQTLKRHSGSAKSTYEALQMPRKTFYDKVSKHGIVLDKFRN